MKEIIGPVFITLFSWVIFEYWGFEQAVVFCLSLIASLTYYQAKNKQDS